MALVRIELIVMGGAAYAQNVIRETLDSFSHDTDDGDFDIPNISSAGQLYGRITASGEDPIYINHGRDPAEIRDGPGVLRFIPEFPEVISVTGGFKLAFSVGDA